MGDEIELKRGLFGVAMYLGTVDFAPGLWLGVRIHEPKGKHDGTVGGRHYFTCRPKHGLFVRPDTLRWHRSTGTPTPLEMPDEMPEAHAGSLGSSNGTPPRPEVGGRTSPRPARTDGAREVREAREARETKGTREGPKERKKEERTKERSKEGAKERTREGTKDARSPDDGRRGGSPRPRGASTGSPGSPSQRTKVKAGAASSGGNNRFKAAARLVVAANKTRALAWASTPAEKSSSSGSSGGSGGGGGSSSSSSSSSSSDSSAKRSVPPPKPPKKKTGSPTSPLGESFRSSSTKVQQSTRLFGKLKKQPSKTAVR